MSCGKNLRFAKARCFRNNGNIPPKCGRVRLRKVILFREHGGRVTTNDQDTKDGTVIEAVKHIGEEYSHFTYNDNGDTRRELLARSRYAHCTNHPRNGHPYRSRGEMPKVMVMDAATDPTGQPRSRR